MKKVLIAYSTLSGSTRDVARTIGEAIANSNGSIARLEVDLLPLDEIADLSAYDAVVVGAPMILGWQRPAAAFLKKHSEALEHVPLAMFATALSLTVNGETSVNGVPVFADPLLAKQPENPKSLTYTENYARISRYAVPMLQAAGGSNPVSLAFFGGKLDYTCLKPLAWLFVKLLIRAQPGDRRNWEAIQAWGASLPRCFDNGNSSGQANQHSRPISS